MAEKKLEEGTREPGEVIPPDDSHIAAMALKAIQDAAAGLAVDPAAGTGTDPAAVSAEMVDVEIDGTTFKMTKEGAEAYSKQQAVHVDNLAAAQNAGEAENTGEAASTEEATNYQTLFYTDPDEAVRRIKDEVTTELRNEYVQDKALDIFWGDFYRENPELREEDTFVRMVLGSRMDELKDLKGKTGRDGLAKVVQGELLRIQNKAKGGAGKRTETRDLEGALPGAEKPSEPADTTTPSRVASLGDAIKDRNLARRKAAGKSA